MPRLTQEETTPEGCPLSHVCTQEDRTRTDTRTDGQTDTQRNVLKWQNVIMIPSQKLKVFPQTPEHSQTQSSSTSFAPLGALILPEILTRSQPVNFKNLTHKETLGIGHANMC